MVASPPSIDRLFTKFECGCVGIYNGDPHCFFLRLIDCATEEPDFSVAVMHSRIVEFEGLGEEGQVFTRIQTQLMAGRAFAELKRILGIGVEKDKEDIG